MNADSRDCVLDLAPKQMLRLDAAAGLQMKCHGGTLWVTQEGCVRDDFLSAGDALVIIADGVTLVEAIGKATARLTLLVDQHGNLRMGEDFCRLAAHQQP